MSEDLLTCLGRQVGEPFPTGQGIGASSSELTVDLCHWRTLGDATAAARVPLVQKVPECASRMSLPVERRGLECGRVEPSAVRSAPDLACGHIPPRVVL